MKLLTILAAVAPIIATVQAAKPPCYNDGYFWYGEPEANAFIDRVCNSGGISGYFNQGQTKYSCQTVNAGGPDFKFQLWVQWRGAGGLTLNDYDCKGRLKALVNGCSHGGEYTVADWYFRADPNAGPC